MAHPTTTSALTSQLLARHQVRPEDLPELARKDGIDLRVRTVYDLLNGTKGTPTPSLAYAVASPLGEPLHALRPDLAPSVRRNPLVEIIAGKLARGEFTARELADKAGINDAWVYNALAGKMLNDPIMRALCGVLGVDYPPQIPYVGMRSMNGRPDSIPEPEPEPEDVPAPAPPSPPPAPVDPNRVLDEAPPGWMPAADASKQAGHDRDYARYLAKLNRVPSIRVKGPTPTGYAWYVRSADFPPPHTPVPQEAPAPLDGLNGPDLPLQREEPPAPAPAPADAPIPVEPEPVVAASDTSNEDNLLWLLVQAVSVAARNSSGDAISDTAWNLALCQARILKVLATDGAPTPNQLQMIAVLEGLIDPAASKQINLNTMYSVLGNIVRSRKSEDPLDAELLRGLDLALALRDERNPTNE